MKFIDKVIQAHLLNGGKIKRATYVYAMFLSKPLAKLAYNYKDKIVEYSLTKDDLTSNDWEIADPEYDWDKIIADKVLCRFWNDTDAFSNYIFGKLGKVKDGRFNLQHSNIYFDNCEPVGIPDITITDNPEIYRR